MKTKSIFITAISLLLLIASAFSQQDNNKKTPGDKPQYWFVFLTGGRMEVRIVLPLY